MISLNAGSNVDDEVNIGLAGDFAVLYIKNLLAAHRNKQDN